MELMPLKFKANVLKKFIDEDLVYVKLDRTYFYPDGAGGQLGDRGTIDGKRVLGILKRNNEILHILGENIENNEVMCEIDAKRRFDISQQHTGQHILSAVFQNDFNARTISFHMGEEYSTIDLDTIYLTKEMVEEVERKCLKHIIEAKDIKVYFIDRNKISLKPFRKIPDKLPERARVVEIPGVDLSLCGGTHVKNTAEVGLIKILKWEKVRGKNTRVYFICGNRALKDYQLKNSILYDIGNILSVGIKDVLEKIEKEHEELRMNFKMIKRLKRELAIYIADEVYADAIVKGNDRYLLRRFEDIELGRYVAGELAQKRDAVFFLEIDDEKPSLIMGKGNEAEYDMLSAAMDWKRRFGLRGGGKGNIITLCFEDKYTFGKVLDDIRKILEVNDVQKTL